MKILLIILSFFSTFTFANCQVAFSDVSNVNWQGNGKDIGYDIFDSQSLIQEVTFNLVRAFGNDACQIAIGLTTIDNTDRTLKYQNNKLEYNLYLDRNLNQVWRKFDYTPKLKGLPIVTFGPHLNINDNTADLLSNTNPEIDKNNLTISQERILRNKIILRANKAALDIQQLHAYLNIPAEQLLPPGNYSQELIMSAYSIDDNEFILQDQQKFVVSTNVKSKLDIAIGKFNEYSLGANKHYKISFGALDYGKVVQDSFNLLVRANSKFSYQVISKNLGKLILSSGYESTLGLKKEFPYLMNIDSIPHEFNTEMIYSFDPTNIGITRSGTIIPMQIIINGDIDLENYHPGIYSDSVFITVSSL